MPRGVYDRSKSKEQRAAEKAGAAKGTKGIKAKAAKVSAPKTVKTAASKKTGKRVLRRKMEPVLQVASDDLDKLIQHRTMIASTTPNSELVAKFDREIAVIIDRRGADRRGDETESQDVAEAAPAPAPIAHAAAPMPAPVPFNQPQG